MSFDQYEYTHDRLSYIESLEARTYELIRKKSALEDAIKRMPDWDRNIYNGLGQSFEEKVNRIKNLIGYMAMELANARDNGYIRRIP